MKLNPEQIAPVAVAVDMAAVVEVVAAAVAATVAAADAIETTIASNANHAGKS
jgi:hypothetical protein